MTTQEINLKIHEESDLYSPYDPKQKLLSEDVLSHLERNYINKHRSIGERFVLHIYSDTPLNEKDVVSSFSDYYSQEIENLSYQIKKLTGKQIGLIIFGVVFLSLWVYLSLIMDDAVKLEIVSIMGWVAIWEATSISIMQRPELVAMKKNYEQLLKGKIIFHVEADHVS